MPWNDCCVGRTLELLLLECVTLENENGIETGGLLLFCQGDCCCDVDDRYWKEVELEVFWNQLGKLGGGRLLPPRRNPRLRPRPRPRSKFEEFEGTLKKKKLII